MTLKTATSLAFAAACLTTVATLPSQAQMTGTYGNDAPQSYQGNPSPNWSGNPYGSANWSAGRSGSTSGTYAPQSYQGNIAPYSAGSSGTEVVTNGPQTDPDDVSPSWSAQQNVIQSRHYDRLVETNQAFRQARMRKECGPISDPQLRQDCLVSFSQAEPYTGSSTPRRNHQSGSGR